MKINSVKIFSSIFIFALVSCETNEDSYVLTVYPDKNTLLNDISLEGFKSLEQCRVAANKMISNYKYENADYEFGKNCRKIYDPLGDYFSCEE